MILGIVLAVFAAARRALRSGEPTAKPKTAAPTTSTSTATTTAATATVEARVYTVEEELDCTGCQHPCDEHAAIPRGMARRIVRDRPLAGSVKPYGKHLVVLVRDTESRRFPERDKNHNEYVAHVLATLGGMSDALPYKVKTTLAEYVDGVNDDGTAVGADNDACEFLLFPEMLRFGKVKKGSVAAFLTAIFADNSAAALAACPFPSAPLNKQAYVLVCCHKLRDKRCGVIGELLCTELATHLDKRDLSDEVVVLKSSHTGGHDYAGNVIVYPGGHWYGRLSPCHCAALVDDHVVNGKLLTSVHRGQIKAVQRGDDALLAALAAEHKSAMNW
jgi:hypothetical protein